MAWFPTEKVTIAQGLPVTGGAVNTYQNVFPLDGTGYTHIRLIFHGAIAAVVTPYAEAIYRWIKGVTLTTSRGEVLFRNVPGMALYKMNALLDGSSPQHDQILAAGNTWDAVLDLKFCLPFLARPEDLIFDSGRYSNLTLEIATGTLADLSPAGAVDWTAPGVTMDIEVERTLSALINDGKSKPYAHVAYQTYPLIHANVQTFWDLESSVDLALFAFMIANHDATGVPFCEAAAGSDTLTNVTFEDTVRRWVLNQRQPSFRNDRHKMWEYDWYQFVVGTSIPTGKIGLYPYWFVRNGSFKEVYPTGKKSMIRLSFTNPTATDEADLLTLGMRALR